MGDMVNPVTSTDEPDIDTADTLCPEEGLLALVATEFTAIGGTCQVTYGIRAIRRNIRLDDGAAALKRLREAGLHPTLEWNTAYAASPDWTTSYDLHVQLPVLDPIEAAAKLGALGYTISGIVS